MAATSSTSTVQLQQLNRPPTPKNATLLNSEGHRLGSNEDVTGGLPAPTTTATVTQKWNYPRANANRVLSCFWSLFVSGANDAAYGALIPYLESYYNLSYVVVSLVFLSPFVGYVLSALLNNWIHLKVGQRGIAVIASSCHIAAYVVISQHPPYPALVVVYILVGFGNGISDAAWNAYIGNMDRANEVLGFLHAFYGAGGVLSPLIATTMIDKGKLGWWTFYYVLLGMAVIELVWCTSAFWTQTGAVYRETIAQANAASPTGSGNSTMRAALFKRPYARVSWLCAVFLLAYVGFEVSLGGWIVQFMIQVRKANPFDSGMTSVGFWLGITLGRALLGFVTPKLGVKLAVALQGFFLGPFFPAVVVAATKLLPRHLHVSTIGFAAAFGGSGAAILPFAVGVLAQAKGVQVLQPIILACLGVMLGLWLCLPRIGHKEE
ncbi:hypothetical protein COL922a_012761 [Colletotrichum nupharicola]|nr:hypothetical protein COL922a_012761 [Colletotrichum nupharicola]